MAKAPSTRRSTAVTDDYLKAIWHVEEWGGDGITVNALAQLMGVVASTASENVTRLTDAGLVDHEPYRKVHLTAEGRTHAIAMVRRHRLLETYLHRVLGFDWDEVHEEAEILEHAISDRLLDRIDSALGHPRRDPHGDPIPQPGEQWVPRPTRPLADALAGETVTVERIDDDDPAPLRLLDSLGIGPDTRLEVLDGTHPGTGVRVRPLPVPSEGTAPTPAPASDGVLTLPPDVVAALHVSV